MAETGSKRKLEDLRVVDLRAELEKFGLDQKGVKATLMDRLKQALIDQKLDPDAHEFIIDEYSGIKKAASKSTKLIEKEELMEQDAENEDEEEEGFESLADLVESDHEEAGEEFEFGESLIAKKSEVKKMEETKAKKDGHMTTEPPTTKSDDHVMASSESSTNVKRPDQQNEEEAESAVVESDGEESEKQEQQDNVPNPENVEPQFAFTAEDTIKMHQATADQAKQGGKNNALNDDANSMFVNADETMSDLDASSDLAPSSVANDSTLSATQGQGQPQTLKANSDAPKPPNSASQSNKHSICGKNSTENELEGASVKDQNKNLPPPPKKNAEEKVEQQTATNLAEIDAPEKDNTTKNGGQNGENIVDSEKSEALEVKQKQLENSTPKTSTTPVAKKVEAKPTESSESLCKSVWVIGISSTIKAADLKSVFSKYGRVVTAKVMSSKSKSDGSRWYGFVTMASSEEASKCIQHLHRTELHGKMISVERATDPKGNMVPPKKAIAAATAAAGVAAPDGTTGKQSEAQKQPTESSESGATTDAGKQAVTTEKAEQPNDQEATKKSEQQETSAENADQQKSSATASKSESADKKKEVEKSKDTKSGDKKSRSPRSDRDRSRRSRDRRERDERDRRRDATLRASRAGRRGGPFRPGYSSRGGGRPPVRRPGGPPHSTRPSYPRGGSSAMRGGRGAGGPPHRRVDSSLEFERRRRENEMLERLRQKEAEHRQREEMLRLQREKERLRFEREKLEREKLELQHQHQQMRFQVAYERSYPIQQTQPMLSVKRAYEGLNPFSAPPEPKRPAYVPSSMPPNSSRSNGRARTSPRNYSSGGRDSYRGSNGRYESSRDSRSSRNRPSDSYRDRSSSSRRPEDSGGRSSRPLPSGSGGSRRSYPSPSGGRRTSGRDEPPPPLPRQSWGGGPSGGGASSGGRHSGGGMGRSGSDRDLGGPYGAGSHGNVSNNASASGVWSGDSGLPSNNSVWGRAGMSTQVSTALWSAPPSAPMYGSVENAGASNSYVNPDRFDAYKYPMSSTRRY